MRKTNFVTAIFVGMIMIPVILFGGLLPVPKSHKKMAIITTEALSSAADSFKLWHNALGETTYVYFANDIYNGYIGRDKQEKIRSFIKYLNEIKNINTILFLGDTSIIPIRCAKYSGIYNNALIPTDLYYSDLNGNWDANGNGIYGEYINGNNVDNVDGYPDILVGRIPLNTNEELIGYLDRMIKYETSAPAYDIHFWGASINESNDGIGQMYSLMIRNDLPDFITSEFLFNPLIDTFTSKPRWVGDEELTRQNAIGDIEKENYFIVHIENGGYDWLGTGYITEGEKLNVYNINNVKTSFFISSASYGALPKKGSVGYAFLSNGGLAFIGNTSLGIPVEAIGFDRLVRNIFSDSTEYLGEAFSKIYSDSMYINYTMNYLGDPLLRTYKNYPSRFSYEIKFGLSSINIKLNEPNAYVSFIRNDSVAFAGFTDSNGCISFPYYRDTDAKIVVSKKGFVTSIIDLNRYNGVSEEPVTSNQNDGKFNIKNANIYSISGRYLGKYGIIKTKLTRGVYIVSNGKYSHKISLIK